VPIFARPIAVHALAEKLALVTNNEREFKRIK
jgi:predicted nucleic acid-binding protein